MPTTTSKLHATTTHPAFTLRSSLYHTTTLPPTTPTTTHYIPFPSSGYDPVVNYASWDTRQRRPSWHGPHSADWLHPSYPPFLGPYAPRHSFSTTFAPLRFFGPGQSAMLSADEMHELATYPPLTHLRIICDLTPNWPTNLEFRQPSSTTPYSPHSLNQLEFTYQQPSPPPITLADVLIAIHQAMHHRITHVDWAKLNRQDKRTVTKAYLRRCGVSEHERAQGVKRVDFLLGRTRMVGLVRSVMEDGWEVMRLVLADR